MDVTSATVGLRCEPEGVAVLGTVSQRDEVWWGGVGREGVATPLPLAFDLSRDRGRGNGRRIVPDPVKYGPSRNSIKFNQQ